VSANLFVEFPSNFLALLVFFTRISPNSLRARRDSGRATDSSNNHPEQASVMKLVGDARLRLIACLGASVYSSVLLSAPVKLNGTLVPGGNVDASFRFSPDSSRILYAADQNVGTGGVPQKLNGSLVLAGDVVEDSARVSPDSSHVLYIADQITDNKFELYNVPITGTG
jgi:hypothetical protein